jgi:hypothetical protein
VATCPDCGGYLGDDHHCRGRRRRRQREVVVGGSGAFVGLIASFFIFSGPRTYYWLVPAGMTVLGGVIAISVWRAIPAGDLRK